MSSERKYMQKPKIEVCFNEIDWNFLQYLREFPIKYNKV